MKTKTKAADEVMSNFIALASPGLQAHYKTQHIQVQPGDPNMSRTNVLKAIDKYAAQHADKLALIVSAQPVQPKETEIMIKQSTKANKTLVA